MQRYALIEGACREQRGFHLQHGGRLSRMSARLPSMACVQKDPSRLAHSRLSMLHARLLSPAGSCSGVQHDSLACIPSPLRIHPNTPNLRAHLVVGRELCCIDDGISGYIGPNASPQACDPLLPACRLPCASAWNVQLHPGVHKLSQQGGARQAPRPVLARLWQAASCLWGRPSRRNACGRQLGHT